MRKKIVITMAVLAVIASLLFITRNIDLIGILKRMHGG